MQPSYALIGKCGEILKGEKFVYPCPHPPFLATSSTPDSSIPDQLNYVS
jgi:hypothetical protein